MFNKKHLALLASAGSLSLAGMATAQADTLEDTIERGAVRCERWFAGLLSAR